MVDLILNYSNLTIEPTLANTTIRYQTLHDFNQWYRSVHGYASLVICLLGVTLNFFNIIVLTRKHMISSTNTILTAVAISDLLTMLVYIPASLKFYCVIDSINADKTQCSEVDAISHTFFWTAYALFYVNVTVTMHSISIWLTVLLAFFRYLYICHNKIGQRVCTLKNTIISVLLTGVFCIILCSPSYVVSKIVPITPTTPTNQTLLYEIAQSDLDVQLNGLIFRITFFSQSFCLKLIPCLLLIVLSSLLIHSIHKANKTNKRLQSLGRKSKESEKSREHTRTNIMLVLVCVIFFVTEFPQGILAISSIIFEQNNFHVEVYMKLGDIMDLLALINNSINFILYCLMSRIFRRTFKDIFCRFICLHRGQHYASLTLLNHNYNPNHHNNDNNSNYLTVNNNGGVQRQSMSYILNTKLFQAITNGRKSSMMMLRANSAVVINGNGNVLRIPSVQTLKPEREDSGESGRVGSSGCYCRQPSIKKESKNKVSNCNGTNEEHGCLVRDHFMNPIENDLIFIDQDGDCQTTVPMVDNGLESKQV